MERILLVACCVVVMGCGGGAPKQPTQALVQYGDPGEDNLAFATPRLVIVDEQLEGANIARILRHELMHVAGMDGHPTSEACIANGNAAFWPDTPCPSDIVTMTQNLPNDPIVLVVVDPSLFAPTSEAAEFWNGHLSRTAFVVEAGF